MKHKFSIISVIATLSFALLTSGCSDFTNSDSSDAGKQAPKPPTDSKKESENPFEPGFNPNEGEFSETKMLANIGLNVIQPLTKDLRLQLELLNSKLENFCESLSVQDDSASKEAAAKDQWKESMLSFHRLNAGAVGPVFDDNRKIYDGLYSWPLVNNCGIDLATLKWANLKEKDSASSVTVRGLAAIEYLLFEPSLTSQCNMRNPNFQPVHDWAKKPDLEKKKDRCFYALELNKDNLALAQELETAWDQNKANFSKSLIDGSRFANIRQAVNAFSDALFIVETSKDARLGKPLGLHPDCRESSGKCPEMAEHPWSGLALSAIEAQLQGFQQIFWGAKQSDTPAFGFDDYLKASKRSDVTERMNQISADVRQKLKVLSQGKSLQELIAELDPTACRSSNKEDRKVEICAFFTEYRELATLLKTDFLIALSLRAPPVFSGDND